MIGAAPASARATARSATAFERQAIRYEPTSGRPPMRYGLPSETRTVGRSRAVRAMSAVSAAGRPIAPRPAIGRSAVAKTAVGLRRSAAAAES